MCCMNLIEGYLNHRCKCSRLKKNKKLITGGEDEWSFLGNKLIIIYLFSLFVSFKVVFNTCIKIIQRFISCLLYTSDAADDMQCVDLGGRRIIKKRDRSVD